MPLLLVQLSFPSWPLKIEYEACAQQGVECFLSLPVLVLSDILLFKQLTASALVTENMVLNR